MNGIRAGVGGIILLQMLNVGNNFLDSKIVKGNKDEVINAGIKNSAQTNKQIASLDSTIKANTISYKNALEAMNAKAKAREVVTNKEIQSLNKTLKALSKQLASATVADTAKIIKTIR